MRVNSCCFLKRLFPTFNLVMVMHCFLCGTARCPDIIYTSFGLKGLVSFSYVVEALWQVDGRWGVQKFRKPSDLFQILLTWYCRVTSNSWHLSLTVFQLDKAFTRVLCSPSCNTYRCISPPLRSSACHTTEPQSVSTLFCVVQCWEQLEPGRASVWCVGVWGKDVQHPSHSCMPSLNYFICTSFCKHGLHFIRKHTYALFCASRRL
jgi:hypothetical protein